MFKSVYHWLATAFGSQEWCFPMMMDVELRSFCKPHLRWWLARTWSDAGGLIRLEMWETLLESVSSEYYWRTRMILKHLRVLGTKTSTQYPVRTMITMITIMILMMMMMTWWWWCSELMAGSRRPTLGQRWLLTCYPRVINPHLDSALFFIFSMICNKKISGRIFCNTSPLPASHFHLLLWKR